LDDDEYALQLADAIEDHGMQAEALERIALVKARKGEIEKAIEISDSMLHPEYVFGGIAVYQASNGDQPAADATLGRIEYANARVTALQQIVRSQITAKDMESALATLENAVMAAGEIEHEEEKIRALCELGTLFIEAGRSDKAVETFGLAQDAAEVLDNIHRDFSLVNCALGFLYAGDEDRADAALDLVTDKTQMSSALVGFSRAYWDDDRKEEAVETLDEAYAILKSQRDIETRDSRARNSLMASIAAQFAAFGKADRGTEIALENADHDDKIAALAQIAQVLTLDRQDDLARRTVNLIDEDAERLFAFVGLSDAKKNLGEEAASVVFLDEAADLAETIPQLAARSSVLNSIASHYVEHGQPEKAGSLALQSLDIIAEIRDESSQAAAMANLSEIFTMANVELSDAGRWIIDNMIREADRPA
jgi:tetratricopeptide (TPR) repeat protein